LLYGNGDGGGGPLQPMIERLSRMQAVEGLPATIEFKNPNTFYDQLAEHSKELNVWQGELYFELHRGTYTSHCIIKKYNRMCELLLREVEILYVFGCTLGVAQYPYKELEHLWKLVLLNQFHDVLPGSSIQIVYPDAIKVLLYSCLFYEEVVKVGNQFKDSIHALLLPKSNGPGHISVFNSLSFARPARILAIAGKPNYVQQFSSHGEALVYVPELKPMAFSFIPVQTEFPVKVKLAGKFFYQIKCILRSSRLKMRIIPALPQIATIN
jgi:alpha-mannosidase